MRNTAVPNRRHGNLTNNALVVDWRWFAVRERYVAFVDFIPQSDRIGIFGFLYNRVEYG
jgi:hypothetical protein